MKENDWIIATLNNPNYGVFDFLYLAGLTIDNTQLLPKEKYMASNYIQSRKEFADDDGNFSELKFTDFYNAAANTFSEFLEEELVNSYEYSIWDNTRPSYGKVRDIDFKISKIKNPDHISIGIEGLNTVTPSNKSKRELALNSNIYDPETGTFLDKSVNDISLTRNPIEYFKSIIGDPLVYALYDEDTIEVDPDTGKEVLHYKGEWKVNPDGEYYVEKLNGRSLLSKSVVSVMDYLTPEDSSINKYDFFDSDDLKKSTIGSTVKNIVAVLPLFTPFGKAYSGILIARDLATTFPMLNNLIGSLAGNEDTNNLLINTIAAYSLKFKSSTSDYSQENTFTWENIANLMSDVAIQWGLQRLIASTFSKLTGGGNRAVQSAYAKALNEYVQRATKAIEDTYRGKLPVDKMAAYIGTSNITKVGEDLLKTGKWMETPFGKAAISKYVPATEKLVLKRLRMGQNLSLIYMALVSNTDVYDSVKEHGGTNQEAALISLGSMVGMYGVDKYLGLGELFFLDEPARKAFREVARRSADELIETAGLNAVETTTKKGVLGLLNKGINAGKRAVSNYRGAIKDRTLGFVGKALGEGLEEVSEELVADASKWLAEIAGNLGYASLTDYGAWENAFDRYVMSFLGGALGGSIFYGVDMILNRNKPSNKTQSDLVYLLRLGEKDNVLAEIKKLRDDGKLGSTSLSFKTTETDGKRVFVTAESKADSQNEYIYNTLVKTINLLDYILNDNNLNLSEDELFDKMVLGEYRALALSDFLREDKDNVKNLSYITKYQLDFLLLAEKILNKEAEILQFIATTPDPSKRGSAFLEKLDKLKAEKADLLKLRDYLFGEGSLGYVEKMLFAMDTNLSGQFMPLNYALFVRSMLGKSVENLTEAEDKTMSEQWKQSKDLIKNNLDVAFNLYKSIEKKVNPSIQLTSLNASEYLKQSEDFLSKLFLMPEISYDTRLEEETDEDYDNRRTLLEGETDELYRVRTDKRSKALESLYEKQLSDWISTISDLKLDRNQFRTIESLVLILKKNLKLQLIQRFQISNNPELTHKIWSIIENSDLTDINALKELIQNIIRSDIQSLLKDLYDRISYELVWYDLAEEMKSVGVEPLGYITYGDMYQFLEATKEHWKDLGPELFLSNLTLGDLKFGTELDAQTIANDDFIKWYTASLLNEEIREQYWATPLEITEPYIDKTINDLVDTLFLGEINPDTEERNTENGLSARVDQIVKELQNSPLIKSLDKLESKKFEVNPVKDIIETISKVSTNSSINIHEFLEGIYELYNNGANALEFELTSEQESILTQFIKDALMAQAFINAASSNPDYTNAVLHNKSLNLYRNNHTDVYGKAEPLPEIENDYAAYLINEAGTFIKEAQNWIRLSRLNIANKTRKFNITEGKYLQAISEFYKTNRDAFKINEHVDLLDGFEDLEVDSSLLTVSKILQLIYNNFLKALSLGITFTLILDLIIPKIVNDKEIVTQLISELNELIDYSKLTSYDKFELFISSLALSPKLFYSKLKNFIEENSKIASISTLEVVGKIVQALLTNPKLVNDALDWIVNKYNIKVPILHNTSIILGLGGSGKTAVLVKMLISNDSNVWISGPSQTLIDGLHNILSKATTKTKDELFTAILGEQSYTDFKNNAIKNNKIAQKWGSKINGIGESTVKLNDNINVNKLNNAPKYIVIDEATHFNALELLILSKFAEKNRSQLLLLGDDYLNGTRVPNLMLNLDREGLFTWRAPKLSVTLRDDNIQKSRNLTFINRLISTIDNSFINETEDNTAKEIINKVIPNQAFHYYNGEIFTGELITKEIPDEVLNNLNGSIGFIGTTSSTAYLKLVHAGKNVTVLDPIKVLGLEFDYVVVDKNWNGLDNASDLYFFLKDLNTMITRSRKGSILIANENLAKFHSARDLATGTYSMLAMIDNFRKNRTPLIIEIANTLKEVSKGTTDNGGGGTTDNGGGGTTDNGGGGTTDNGGGGTTDNGGGGTTDNGGGGTTDNGGGGTTDNGGGGTTDNGGTITDNDFEEEDSPKKDNSKDNNWELELSEEENNIDDITTPIRVYLNVSYSGINTDAETWTNKEESIRDLGIFVGKNDAISDGNEKNEIVQRLLSLKCILSYSTDYYDRLPVDIKDRFPKNSFEDVEYYVSVESPSNNNRLIGLTDLKLDERAILGKIITLLAKIKDKNGKVWEITLGGLANPETWAGGKLEDANWPNELKIRNNIEKRIEKYKLLGNLEKVNQLLQYLDNLHANINSYFLRILQLVLLDLQYRINKPTFLGMTTLIKSKKELRIESIEPESTARPFNAECPYAVTSPVYIMSESTPGVSDSVKGKPVMFVSSNILLNANDLMDLYILLKNDPNLVPQVRMIVLDNMGISFNSLIDKRYTDIYTAKDTNFSIPFECKSMGIRMYQAIWNFRANLKRFNERYLEFKRNSELSDDQIKELCKLDYKTYLVIKENLGLEKTDYLDEATYRSKVDTTTKEKLKVIWDFNDSLKDIRQFRLAYSRNGAYIRKLTNLLSDGPYSGKDLNNIQGIYINPDLAILYENILDKLFDNVLENIISSKGIDPRKYMAPINIDTWYKQKLNLSIDIHLINYSGDTKQLELRTLLFKDINDTSAIVYKLVEVYKFLNYKSLYGDDFADAVRQNQNHYKITINDKEINWWDITSDFDQDRMDSNPDGQYDYDSLIPGITYYRRDENKNKIGIIDKRLSNLFNLMFHGLTSTIRYNDFTGTEQRATDAPFKYGFFSDPLMVKRKGGTVSNEFVLTVTNNKLFGADVYPGLPLAGISLNPYKETKGQASIIQLKDNKIFSFREFLQKYFTPPDADFIINSGIILSEDFVEDVESKEDLMQILNDKVKFVQDNFFMTQNTNPESVSNIPLHINGNIIPLIEELRNQSSQDNTITAVEINLRIYNITMSDGTKFNITKRKGDNIVILKTNSNTATNSIEDGLDLASEIGLIIDKYTLPNNPDGLSELQATQLKTFVKKLINNPSIKAENWDSKTRNKIINKIQEELNSTDLEDTDDIMNALTELKNVCKL